MLVSSFNLSQSFNYTPFLFYSKRFKSEINSFCILTQIRRRGKEPFKEKGTVSEEEGPLKWKYRVGILKIFEQVASWLFDVWTSIYSF
jgi:hypothetical protein